MPRHALQLRAGEPVGPLRGIGLRRVQARGGGPLPRIFRAHGGVGTHLPLPQPLRQVVPPALQLRRRHLLRRHRQRPPYTVNDPSVELELLYIDDLVDEMLGALLGEEHRCGYEGLERVEGDGFCYVPETDVKTLGEIVYLLDSFRDSRETLSVPDLAVAPSPRSSGARSCPTTSPGTSPIASGPTWTTAARSRSSCARPIAARSPSTCPGPASPRATTGI